MKEKKNKTKWLKLRVSDEELSKIKLLSKQSTARSFSSYCRATLLYKPVTIRYRNQSLDEFLATFIRLRKDLNGIANNYNQSVKKLHTLALTTDAQQWLSMYATERDAMLKITQEIQDCVDKISSVW
jgi:hypothetical protein